MDGLAIEELYHRREERAIAESDKKYGALCRSIALWLRKGWWSRERLKITEREPKTAPAPRHFCLIIRDQ